MAFSWELLAVKNVATHRPVIAQSLFRSRPKRCHNAFENLAKMKSRVPTKLFADNNVDVGDGRGTYRPFVEYALKSWSEFASHRDIREGEIPSVPEDLRSNSSPSKYPPGSEVRITAGLMNPNIPTVYGRYALIETLGDAGATDYFGGIQVLNFVLMPSPEISMPVFGADVVSLPGDKHLIVIDFQPLRDGGYLDLHPKYEGKLREIHERYSQLDILPWGGDIPDAASRYFSKYALWTRLGGSKGNTDGEKTDTNSNDALHTVQTTLYHAFCEYFDLYLEALDHELSGGGEAGNEAVALSSDQLSDRKISLTGYLNYRSENDPARPMLRRLYGDTFCERLISEVLFPAGARM